MGARRRPRLLAALALAALVQLLPGAAALAPAAEPDCPAARADPLALPHVRRALLANREVTVVALGSSSTAGWRASDVAHSYPAVLQATLAAELPRAHVAVLNRGIAGETARQTLARIRADVMAARPDLVVWQLGANDAMRHVPHEEFREAALQGVQALLAAGMDVVLMDNQKAGNILAAPDHEAYDHIVAEVAKQTGARLFARGGLMEQWRAAGLAFARFMSDDGVHHNDFGYRCLALALARAVVEGAARGSAPGLVAQRP